MRHNKLALLGVATVVFALAASHFASPAAAQGRKRFHKPTPEQVALAEAALEAFVAKDYETAITRYKASLAIQPLNITYITMGYALYAQGRCQEAAEAYEAAAEAPRVKPPPSPREIQATLEAYAAELPTRCGKIKFTCEPARMTVTMKETTYACDSGPLWIVAGTHSIKGDLGNGLEARQEVTITAGQESTLSFTMPDLSVEEVTQTRAHAGAAANNVSDVALGLAVFKPPPEEPWELPSLPVIIVGSTGAALLVATLGFDLFVTGPTFEEYERASRGHDLEALMEYQEQRNALETQQTVEQIMFASGLVLTGTATVLYLLGVGNDAELALDPPLRLILDEDGALVAVEQRW